MSEDEHKIEREENQGSMDSRVTRNLSDQGFWREMLHQIRLAWYLVKSPDVPLYLKVLPALAVIYVLIPTDLIPDVFPVIGQLDDLTALIVGAKVFIELAPQDVVNRRIRSMRSQTPANGDVGSGNGQSDDSSDDSIVIEGDFQVVEDGKENRAD
ncbi:MAG TPA: DUF1232 domain-containing protein [Patescibacteria group bacterium]|nr:DUF1232 domain-containing protein [Patescibacteria group bacterium]